MKEDLKTVLFMGLGALAETNEKMKDVKDSLYTRGKELYEKGVIANEELKHNINEAMKERVTVVNVNSNKKEDIIDAISNMSDEDKEEILKSIKVNKKSNKEEK
ncbi:MAG TPA: hypothetical protein IAC02_00265 [Candidatus Coprovivens excrementavium]|nr:hypothetical protein [Candidatus Coprovivens excrementavium]